MLAGTIFKMIRTYHFSSIMMMGRFTFGSTWIGRKLHNIKYLSLPKMKKVFGICMRQAIGDSQQFEMFR